MSTPSDNSHDPLTDHKYDGIQEYDNPMPGWWKGIFYITIVWSVVYVVGISIGAINDYEGDLTASLDELEQVQKAHKASQPKIEITAASLAALATDAEYIKKGQSIYTRVCAACHGDVGQGLIGPNLTDDHWIHSSRPLAMVKMVTEGVPEKGMPAWGPMLTELEVVSVVVFVRSLRGTNPANAKAPQGELESPEEKEAPDDGPPKP